jgi:AcrR family transcriptional regulator
VLEAAAALIAAEGVEGLTMRRLAIEADVSVATVYNLIGGRSDVVRALSVEVLGRFDETLFEARSTDPLDRARELVGGVIDIVTTEVSPRLVLAALDDEILTDELGEQWQSSGLLGSVLQAMIERGELDGDLSPDALADQVWFSYTRFLRLWASGLLDEREFRARSLYALDVCLLAQATDAVREGIVTHARGLEAEFSSAGTVLAGSPMSVSL